MAAPTGATMRVRIHYRTICVTLLWIAVGALAATLWVVRGDMREMEERLETIEERPAIVFDLKK